MQKIDVITSWSRLVRTLNRTSSRFPWIACSLLLGSCSLFAVRPVRDMSETTAALRAAKEVQADVLAPELFRQASEYFFKAKREYKFKNFEFATIYAQKARRLAEDAEFEALRNGGNRTSEQVPDPLANTPAGLPHAAESSPPSAVPTPQGTPVEVFEQRKASEDEIIKKINTPSNGTSPATPPVNSPTPPPVPIPPVSTPLGN